MNVVAMGFLGSLLAGLMTALGAIPVLFGKRLSKRANDTLLGFAAGVMLAASFFSLIIPGIDLARGQLGGNFLPATIAVAGVLFGTGFVALLNTVVPHEHFVIGVQGPVTEELAKIWLFVFAITIHNIPEGLAVGVGFGGGNFAHAMTLATGIGLQNAPEGLAVAVALTACGYSRRDSFWIAAITGMVEPAAGLLGAWSVTISQAILPWALTFAAGAMIYVIVHEIVPETHHHGEAGYATLGFIGGLAIMMFLDLALSP